MKITFFLFIYRAESSIHCWIDWWLTVVEHFKRNMSYVESEANSELFTNCHAKSILTTMNMLRKTHTLCDVTLHVDSVDFPAHRIVLAACSDYFCAMFTNEVMSSSAVTRIMTTFWCFSTSTVKTHTHK